MKFRETWYLKSRIHYKQPSRGVLRKRCSKNMQQIYRRTPMPNFIEITLRHGCSAVDLLHIFRTSLDGCFCITIIFERKEPFWWVKFCVNFRLFNTIIQLVFLKKFLCDLRFFRRIHLSSCFSSVLIYDWSWKRLAVPNEYEFDSEDIILNILHNKSFSLGQKKKKIMYVCGYPTDPDKKYRPLTFFRENLRE